MKDIYDRVEKYLDSDQIASRGTALIALIGNLPDSEIRQNLLSIIASQSKSETARQDAGAKIVQSIDLNRLSPNSFIGKPVFEKISDIELRVVATYGVKDSDGNLWEVPEGFVYSGELPEAVWSAVGSPFEDPLRAGLALYQSGVETQTRSSSETAKMLYEALISSGIKRVIAQMIYYAALRFGPTWG